MNKKFGLASAFAAVLMVSSASVAFAADPTVNSVNKDLQEYKVQNNKDIVNLKDNGDRLEEKITKANGKIRDLYETVGEMGSSFEEAPDGSPTAIDSTAREGVADNKAKIAKNTKSIDEINSLNDIQSAAIDHNAKRLDENDSMNTIQNAAIDRNTQGLIDTNQRIRDTSKADRAYTDEVGAKTLSSANAYTDSVAISTLNKANAYTDSRYNQLNSKMNKLRARVDSGVAGATAIGSLAFDGQKANSIAGGLSVAKNKVAGAVGYQRNFNANWRARATVAVSDNYVQGGASVGYSW